MSLSLLAAPLSVVEEAAFQPRSIKAESGRRICAIPKSRVEHAMKNSKRGLMKNVQTEVKEPVVYKFRGGTITSTDQTTHKKILMKAKETDEKGAWVSDKFRRGPKGWKFMKVTPKLAREIDRIADPIIEGKVKGTLWKGSLNKTFKSKPVKHLKKS
jgi:hypothetical protein